MTSRSTTSTNTIASTAEVADLGQALVTPEDHCAEIVCELPQWSNFQRTLDRLLNQRTEHEHIRQSHDFAALWASRAKLDELRLTLARQRNARLI